MKTLGEHELIQFQIPQTSFTLWDYAYGRCHIFAQALHEHFGYHIECMWDIDFWFEDSDIPSTVLVHAYCVANDYFIDARGVISKKTIDEEYEYNEKYIEPLSLNELHETIQNNALEKPRKGELDALKTFIKEHKFIYQ